MKAALQLVSRWTRLSEIKNGTSARFLFSGGSRTDGKETEERRPVRKSRRRFAASGVAMNKPYLKPSEFNPNADWSSVFQAAQPFDPFLVPLPLRMGRPPAGELPPPAVNNAELLKITNFLHLTPPAIEKQCAALKSLCTPWPKHPWMPVRITTRNYVFPHHNIRHGGATIVKLKVSPAALSLNERAHKKMISLAGPRYNPETDTITLTGKRCPTRKQNRDYVMHLLVVLYMESKKVESWETEEQTPAKESSS